MKEQPGVKVWRGMAEQIKQLPQEEKEAVILEILKELGIEPEEQPVRKGPAGR
jgi:hypothetical protein